MLLTDGPAFLWWGMINRAYDYIKAHAGHIIQVGLSRSQLEKGWKKVLFLPHLDMGYSPTTGQIQKQRGRMTWRETHLLTWSGNMQTQQTLSLQLRTWERIYLWQYPSFHGSLFLVSYRGTVPKPQGRWIFRQTLLFGLEFPYSLQPHAVQHVPKKLGHSHRQKSFKWRAFIKPRIRSEPWRRIIKSSG